MVAESRWREPQVCLLFSATCCLTQAASFGIAMSQYISDQRLCTLFLLFEERCWTFTICIIQHPLCTTPKRHCRNFFLGLQDERNAFRKNSRCFHICFHICQSVVVQTWTIRNEHAAFCPQCCPWCFCTVHIQNLPSNTPLPPLHFFKNWAHISSLGLWRHNELENAEEKYHFAVELSANQKYSYSGCSLSLGFFSPLWFIVGIEPTSGSLKDLMVMSRRHFLFLPKTRDAFWTWLGDILWYR